SSDLAGPSTVALRPQSDERRLCRSQRHPTVALHRKATLRAGQTTPKPRTDRQTQKTSDSISRPGKSAFAHPGARPAKAGPPETPKASHHFIPIHTVKQQSRATGQGRRPNFTFQG